MSLKNKENLKTFEKHKLWHFCLCIMFVDRLAEISTMVKTIGIVIATIQYYIIFLTVIMISNYTIQFAPKPNCLHQHLPHGTQHQSRTFSSLQRNHSNSSKVPVGLTNVFKPRLVTKPKRLPSHNSLVKP